MKAAQQKIEEVRAASATLSSAHVHTPFACIHIKQAHTHTHINNSASQEEERERERGKRPLGPAIVLFAKVLPTFVLLAINCIFDCKRQTALPTLHSSNSVACFYAQAK